MDYQSLSLFVNAMVLKIININVIFTLNHVYIQFFIFVFHHLFNLKLVLFIF